MDSELRDAYRALADDARDYTDVAWVVVSARRRRTRRELLVGVTVLAVVVGAGAGVRLVNDGRRSVSNAATPSPSPSPSTSRAPYVPAPKVSPLADIPLLPAKAVGPAKLLYKTCLTCPTIVLLQSGAQYRLPDPPPISAGLGLEKATLSPDGKVVGYQAAESYVVRRLTDTSVWEVPGGTNVTNEVSPFAWAPGSDALYFIQSWPGAVLDLETGNQQQLSSARTVALSAARRPLDSTGTSPRLEVAERQPNGTFRTLLNVDLAPYLAGGSISGPGSGAAKLANYNLSGGLAVEVWMVGQPGVAALVQFDAAGRIVRRVDKPTGGGTWDYLGPFDGDFAFQHSPDGNQPVELVVVRPSGRTTVTTLPAGATIKLPGAALGVLA